MKKTISLLGLALVAASNVTLASNVVTPASKNVAAIVQFDATPLCVAISKGDVTAVKKFVEYGMDVNERKNGMTPLMFAARYNQPEIAKFLIEKGADIYAKDNNDFTALKHAEAAKATQVIDIIKEASSKK